MKNTRIAQIIVLTVVTGIVAVSGFTFAKLHHEDIDNRISFILTDAMNTKRTEQDFRGKWLLITFGFTHCPDICPLQALTMANTMEHLDAQGLADRIVPVFISVDYLRDTSEKVQAYVDHFDTRFVGLTGTKAQLDLTTDAFQTRYEVSKDPGTGQEAVNVIHSSLLFLIDPSGRMRQQFAHRMDASDLAGQLGTLL